ncbi:MAG: LTA synthase family protein [Bacilli bacterium]|nr:LTA synthase family protein [Bacilli bacterium]
MKNSKWQKVKNILTIFFFIILFFLVCVLVFMRTEYFGVTYEEIIFHLNAPMDGANTPFVGNFFSEESFLLFFGILLVLFIAFFMSKMFYHSFVIKLKMKKGNKTKTKKIKVNNNLRFLVLVPLLLTLIVLYLFVKQVKFDEYVYNINHPTKIYEKYYADAKKTKLVFPEQKRNLIYIYLESMESDYHNLPNDISETGNLIPNLETLAQENINFSDKENELGGAYQTYAVGWTMAGIVAQSAGVPLTVPIKAEALTTYKSFLPGVYALGDILRDEGYNQEFMIGSMKEFGGREKYFNSHGKYYIYDHAEAIKKKKVPKDYVVWWGIEDSKIFQYAEEELTRLSQEDRPFNFQLLTVNTHFDQGYVEDNCGYELTNHYATSVICSDAQIYDFVRWIQSQDFYEDTTIILSGDHLVMGEYLYKNKKPLEERRVYNTFINPALNYATINDKNRTFTTLDMFPSTLSSLGVQIEGERLGLGTNLFSGKKTLAEELGKDELDEELKKRSRYYNNKILYKK